MSKDDARLYAVLAIGGGLGLWWLSRQAGDALGRGLAGLGDAAAGAWGAMSDGGRVRQAIGDAGGYVGDVAAGTVEGIGMAVGIPRTDAMRCHQALASGSYWEASRYCPASDFISGVASAAWPSTTASQATQADVRRVDNALARPDGADVFYTPFGIYGGI